ncbi:MAG: CooT family nickel-binding protein [Eubacteriaceae bacterium]
MCLGKLFDETEKILLMENVTSFTKENGRIIFTSIFGEQQYIVGEIKQVDFSNSKIIIKQAN